MLAELLMGRTIIRAATAADEIVQSLISSSLLAGGVCIAARQP